MQGDGWFYAAGSNEEARDVRLRQNGDAFVAALCCVGNNDDALERARTGNLGG
jgi:hypothetical protein